MRCADAAAAQHPGPMGSPTRCCATWTPSSIRSSCVYWCGNAGLCLRSGVQRPSGPYQSQATHRAQRILASGANVEHMALRRLYARDLFERQTGFRRMRCTADSIADVSALEHTMAAWQVALLLLLDVSSAFDNVHRVVILTRLGRGGRNWSPVALCAGIL